MIDVARAASVSLKTVSRVVNGEPTVRAELGQRVELAILQLGFRPNAVARALRRREIPSTLALVVGNIGDPFCSSIARGVEQVLRRRDMLLVTASSDEDSEQERDVIRALLERRVGGLIIASSADNHRYLLPDIRQGVHIVFVDRPPGQIEADAVLLDNAGDTRGAVERLLEIGHDRIGFVGGPPTNFFACERLRGYREALEASGIREDSKIVRLGVRDATSASRVVHELMRLARPPTALVTGTHRTTIGALIERTRHRVLLPHVGFGCLELATVLGCPLISMSYDPTALGRRAAALVLRRLDGDTSPARWLIEPAVRSEVC